MATLTATVSEVMTKLGISGTGEDLYSVADISDSVSEAVKRYSKDKPRIIYAQFRGQAEYDYDLANVLTSWVDDFSVIRNLEYPAEGQTKQEIEDIDHEIYYPDTSTYAVGTAGSGGTSLTLSTAANAVFFKNRNCIYIASGTDVEVNWLTADGNVTTGLLALKNALSQDYDGTAVTVSRRKALRFNFYEPGTSEVIRAEYTATHTLSDSVDTIPTIDLEAVEDLAVAVSAYKIAANFAKKGRSSIEADAVDYLDKQREWVNLAKEATKRYKEHIGATEDKPSAASADQDLDLFFAWKTDYLFHPRRHR